MSMWIHGDPHRIFASCLLVGAALLAACGGSGGQGSDPEPPDTNGGPVAGGGHAIDGGPVTGDGGIVDSPCIGVLCGAREICSVGKCVPDTTDFDKDGVSVLTDCDDRNPAVHPGAIEICNGKDENCDGQIDDGFDNDGDGYFQCAHDKKLADCNDDNAAMNDPTRPGTPTTNDLFAPFNAHWVKRGSADINTSVQGWSRLTDTVANQTGALWWSSTYTFDHFEMSATFFIQGVTNGTDGVAFAWVPGATLVTGAAGPGYGFKGLGGYAVVIDTAQGTGEAPAPYLTVINSAGTRLATVIIPDVRDSKAHDLRVVLAAGKVSVNIDTTPYIIGFPIPSYVPVIGHWGFTAATGAVGETHFITNVSMRFPDGQSCVK